MNKCAIACLLALGLTGCGASPAPLQAMAPLETDDEAQQNLLKFDEGRHAVRP